jgi:hypothetical protein
MTWRGAIAAVCHDYVFDPLLHAGYFQKQRKCTNWRNLKRSREGGVNMLQLSCNSGIGNRAQSFDRDLTESESQQPES